MKRTRFYTTTEFARLVGLGRHMVKKLCDNGTIKAVMVGRRYAIPETEIASEKLWERRGRGRPPA